MAAWKRQAVRNLPAYKQAEDLESLLVFGYECKVFRDDERARHIDQGRHLIPWMGDATMMIDRYDGRGHLHDLSQYDAERASRAEVSTEEAHLEAMCDEERYLELHTDVQQKAMYEEEEMKRLNEAIYGYGAVGFNYDSKSAQQDTSQQEQDEKEEEEEPFYAPPELQMPKDVIPPSTVKLNAIIEKTALFVSKQGAQMEIVIKTKQKGNTQFEFLDYGAVLNPYYKHMVKMIKAGKYKPRSQRAERKNSTDDNQQGYLHPSLVKKTNAAPVIKEQTREEFINSVSSKLPSGQIEDTPYARLLSNLSKHTGRNSPQPQANAGVQKVSASRDSTPPLHQPHAPPPGPPQHHQHHPGPQDQHHPGPQDQHHQPQQDYTGYEGYDYHYGGVTPHGAVQPPVPGMEPVHLPADPHLPGGHPADPHQPPPPGMAADDMGYIDPGTGLPVGPPPPDLQQVIDKMALYVAKNGPEFELVVCKKQDERFAFLKPGHPHNAYYDSKKTNYQQEFADIRAKEQKKREDDEKLAAAKRQQEEKLQNKSISFSLRSKEIENLPMSLRATALLYDSSGDEEEDEEGSTAADVVTSTGGATPQAAVSITQYTTATTRAQPSGTTVQPAQPGSVQVTAGQPQPGVVSQEAGVVGQQPGVMGQPAVAGQPGVAQNLTTEQRLLMIKQQILAAELEKKQAEMRIKDKLALAAREKLAQTSKDDQIKAERKRKAAMFISMLKTAPPATGGTETSEPDPPPPAPTVSVAPPPARCVSSPSREPSPRPPRSPSVIRITRSRSRSRLTRSRSRSPRRHRGSPHRHRSRSPRKRRKRSPTPPSAYTVHKRTTSPLRKSRLRSRSKTPLRYRRSQRSRSKSKTRTRKSRSRSKTRAKSPSRRKRSRSRSKTRQRKRSRSRTRHRSRSKDRRKRSRSRSKTRKSKSKKKSDSPSRSQKKRSKDKKSDKKSPKNKHSSHKKSSSSKDSSRHQDKPANGDTEDDEIIIHDDDLSSPIHEDGGIISDSDSSSPATSPDGGHDQDVHIVDTSTELDPEAVTMTTPEKATPPTLYTASPANSVPSRTIPVPSPSVPQSRTVPVSEKPTPPAASKPVNKPAIDMFDMFAD